MSEPRFRVGDRVRVIKYIWPEHTYATIVGPFRANQDCGAGHEDDEHGAWPIRLDGYDYRLDRSPNNCHTVADSAIELDVPTDEEIRALFFPQEAQGGPQ